MEKHLRCRFFPLPLPPLPHLDPVRKNSRFRVQAKSCLSIFLSCFLSALLHSVCPCLQGGKGKEEDVLKLRSTTVIVDAWYAQLVVYYCQQQVCVSLLTSATPSHAPQLADCPSAGCRCGRGTALLKSKAAKQTFAAVQEAHTATAHTANTIQHRENIIKHEC